MNGSIAILCLERRVPSRRETVRRSTFSENATVCGARFATPRDGDMSPHIPFPGKETRRPLHGDICETSIASASVGEERS